ncbi:hypothetical protein [Vibrio sp.]|uniref:hypothetical protein n=1 Tax=Vibrio sp. TaxID=678 RepID=UPI003D111038
MSEAQTLPAQLSEQDKSAKTHAIIAYLLMLFGYFTGILFLIGGFWGLVKKGDAKGSIFEDHYSNITKTFFIALVLTLIGMATILFVVGYFIIAITAIYVLWKVIKGLARILSDRPYSS